ncbi:hypothetical protein [Acetobacter sp.]|jgi:hypothetical protein|nr:hypothetical protein [Acetobacter sp.]MCH4091355.1 hypothetical protein [Acetobacter sp.]
MSYPDNTEKTSDAFNADTMMFSGGGGAYVTFNKNGFQYTVFSAIGRWGKHGAPAEVNGVAVQKGEQEIANLACHGPVISNLGADAFQQDGLQPGHPSHDFYIPEAFFLR